MTCKIKTYARSACVVHKRLTICVLHRSPQQFIHTQSITSQLLGFSCPPRVLNSRFICPHLRRPRWTSYCGVAPPRWPARSAPICSSPCTCWQTVKSKRLMWIVFIYRHTVCVQWPSASLCDAAESSHAHWRSWRNDRPAGYPPNWEQQNTFHSISTNSVPSFTSHQQPPAHLSSRNSSF